VHENVLEYIQIFAIFNNFLESSFTAVLICLLLPGKNRRVNKSLLTFTTTSTPFDASLNERDAELPLFDLGTMAAATNSFSTDNKLGQGGFGHVYKVLNLAFTHHFCTF